MRKFLKLTLLCAVLLMAHHIAKAQNKQTTPYVPGEVIVKFKDNNSSAKTSQLAAQMQAVVVKKMPDLGMELWKVGEVNTQIDVKELIEQYKDHPDIDFIEPNYLYSTDDAKTIANPEFSKQWGLHNTGEEEGFVADADIDAPEAWEIQPGSPTIVVGILDTGVDWRHPDLVENIWQNSGEDLKGDGVLKQDENGKWIFDPKDENGIDDDGNGYIDDFIGWNFVDNNNQPFDYKAFEAGEYVQSHGTHVAGIIGAAGNETGVSGVSREVQLAPLKFLSDDRPTKGKGWMAAEAIRYAYKMGMHISSNSWGGAYGSRAIEDAISEAADNNHIFVASAGNIDPDRFGESLNNYYPASYNFDNIIAVANSDYTDQLHQSSNYNVYQIDIVAPGTEIYSCLPYQVNSDKPAYGLKTGVSMAIPMVAGACALLWEKTKEEFTIKNTEVKVAHIKNLILENTDELVQIKGKVATGGRLNVHKALTAVTNPTYTGQYIDCRKRDSTTLSIIYEALGLETFNPKYKPGSFTIDYYDTWGYDNKPMDEWRGVTLNSLGCVSELKVPNIKLQEIPEAIGLLSNLTVLSIGAGYYFDDAVRTYDSSFEEEINDYKTYIGEIDENGANDFHITIPPEIFQLKKLKSLSLGANKIIGSIPGEIAQLQNLEYLNLSYNRLTGEIPIELFSLIKLKEVNLSFNSLNGSLTESIAQLENLEVLDLVYNNLGGNIPATIGDINPDLIDLGFNKFEGSIPNVFKFTGLRHLLLDHNELTGSIAPSISRLVWLDEVSGFDVSHNNLSGCYDPAIIEMGSWFYYKDELDEYRFSLFYNRNVSDGNDFEVAWEEFVNDASVGSCWASETTKVWPGDMNNDGRVTMDDVVYYRIASGNEGFDRPNDDMEYAGIISWKGNLGLDWKNAVYGVNGKHQDANGDGFVNGMDYQVIIDNLGQINPDHYVANDLHYYANGVEMVLRLVGDVSTGNQKVFELRLNNQIEGGAANFHSLSAELQFNETAREVDMEFISDCIDESLSEKIFDEDARQFSFAISKSDLFTCDQVLARILIIVEDAANDDEDKFLRFKINSINSKAGATINETTGSNSSNSLNIDSNEDLFIQVNTTPEQCETGGTAIAEIIGSQQSFNYYWESEDDPLWNVYSDKPAINNLISGAYTLTVIDEDNNEQSISFEIGNNIVLEYDENGMPIGCKSSIESDCFDEMNFDGDISQDTYSAAKQIYTNGNIPKGVEVQLRAGDFIQLDPGFNMENNTFLDIKLEDCSEE